MPEMRKALAGMAYHEVETIAVKEFVPAADGSGHATEVHLVVTVKGAPYPLVMRFAATGPLDALIDSLTKYRLVVWPQTG